MKKVWIHVRGARAEDAPSPHRICWYAGTSDTQVLNAARLQLQLPRDAEFLLRDADGDLVPIASTLPHDQHFSLVLADDVSTVPIEADAMSISAITSSSEQQQAHSALTAISSAVSPTVTALTTMLPPPSGFNNRSDVQAVTSSPQAAVPVPSTVSSPLFLGHYLSHQHKRRKLKTGHGDCTSEPSPGNTDSLSGIDAIHHAPSVIAGLPPSTSSVIVEPSAVTATPHARARSIATIVTQFLETFTRPIQNDDNINFIPNTGKFGLYALYSAVVADASFHPKGQDAFYKMTAMQGKVDRQRVIRFYQYTVPSSGLVEYVQYKPQGKGPFLRKYAGVESERALHELLKRAGFVVLMGLSPETVVAKYLAFVKGFQPISKTVFRAHRQDGNVGIGNNDDDEKENPAAASGQF